MTTHYSQKRWDTQARYEKYATTRQLLRQGLSPTSVARQLWISTDYVRQVAVELRRQEEAVRRVFQEQQIPES